MLCADPEETAPFVRLALERDGALYDVAELDRIFDTPNSPDRIARGDDFHTRVVGRGCAGLDALDARLRAGERPTEARLFPEAFTWLPPCDTERALFARVIAGPARRSFRLGNARALLGHGERVPFPPDETRPELELAVAVVLGEDLDSATEREATSAILGYTILDAWRGADEAERDPAAASLVPSQLGPVLVTADEVADLAKLRSEARVGGTSVAGAPLVSMGSLLASLSWLSRATPLRAGDVIAVTDGASPCRAPWDAPVDLLVERLGKLCGRASRLGPEP